MSCEILSRLDAKTSTWGDTGGSHDPLTPSQISAAMAGANPIGLTILLWKVGHKTPSKGYYSLYNAVIGIGVKNGWVVPKKDVGKARIRSLMEVCLDDYAQPLKCGKCHGTGENEYHKDCPRCKGSGNLDRTNISRAKRIGVHRNTYRKTWVKRYNAVMDYFMDTLHEPEYQAKKKINKGLDKRGA